MSNTPLIKIEDFYIKREDLNQTGSAKDRALIEQINFLKKKKINKAVISSTGNAAISALHFCHLADIDLAIFVSPKINPDKLKLLESLSRSIIQTPKPISDAFKFAKTHQAYFLRQSTDDNAILGYQQIGKEIIKELPQTTSIFIPVGSGATLYGISKSLPKKVKIFAIQPANNPYIASKFDNDYQPSTISLTDALTVKFSPLKNKIINLLKKSGGAYAINDYQIKSSLEFLSKKGITTSPESAMALAGFFKARNLTNVGKYPVIIFTGINR